MTSLRYLSFFLLVWLMSGACRSRQQANTTADSTQTATQSTKPAAKSIVLTERLTALGLTQSGHWRGISLGDSMATVATAEKGQPFEQDATHVGYTIEFPNLESADFLYYQQNGRVSAIDVDLYLNTRPSVVAYGKDLTAYFDQRFGQAVTRAGVTLWTGPQQEQIILKEVSKGKDYGLKIKIAPAGAGTLIVSAK
ncbi:MAG: hypothetical protein H7Z72_20405 [Bacteroidetes bacterium]|nr:hypothetical protein [Fibrella sp.]